LYAATETQVGYAQVDLPQVPHEPEERKVSRMSGAFPRGVCVCVCEGAGDGEARAKRDRGSIGKEGKGKGKGTCIGSVMSLIVVFIGLPSI